MARPQQLRAGADTIAPKILRWLTRPVYLRGLPLAMQFGLVALHWWWCFVLSRDTMRISQRVQWDALTQLGDEHFLMVRSVAVAGMATLALLPLPRHVRELFMGAQIVWLVIVAFVLALVRPVFTGPGAYFVFAYLTFVLTVVSWRTRPDGER